MKFKKIFPMSVIALSLLSCTNTNTSKLNLNNYSIKNMNSYSSFGVGSKNVNNNTNIKKKHIDYDFVESKTPIHFIGTLGNNELSDVIFFDNDNNNTEFDYSLNFFKDSGDFFFFSLLEESYGSGYVCDMNLGNVEYVLSKKTGKIYSLDSNTTLELPISFNLTYSFNNFFYCLAYVHNETGPIFNYYYKFTEEGNLLKSERLFSTDSTDYIYADKFGNILVNGIIYDKSFKKIANIKKNEFSYDLFTNVFYKYNYGEENYYYIDKENNISSTTSPNFDVIVKDYVWDNDYNSCISSFTKKENDFCKMFLIKKENNICYYFINNEMIKLTLDNNGINYAIEKYGSITKNSLNLNIINGNYLYGMDDIDKRFYKYDWHTGTLDEISFEGYDISSFEEDENGILIVKGFTDSLQQFEGYIDENGSLIVGQYSSPYIVSYITSIN